MNTCLISIAIYVYNVHLFQPAGENIVINNSIDPNENTNLCNRYNTMRNDSRSILPCVNDKMALAHQPQQTNIDQHKNQTTINICQRDSGYGSSPDSETIELQTLA